ncbi:MAG: NAD(P)-dependent oxidoreductase [Nitrospina sp.]|jgi:nucleoside-diphosphate-sugar epimerase|nr:NAD(P)-dependent oxidoreductase [Nitrospina sp.]MBT3414402.1 NAD(P)-dependent oxidoreductase [Nitrospina sp.]MBT3856469.1 NAD(P)-dependent oxidoreductase [Nitrospina sp.]MBT4104547.1 NAD(P)-dependent oxidoreductase [Nitrospina sp.]MBT4389430.1 NAD(P)-dependent oxidoreductase [Nitrospina sp.]
MNIALTGITGMLGSHLIKKIVEENPKGHNVRALIREGSVVEHLKTFEDVDFIIGGLEDRESLAKLVQDAEVLIHLAHFPGPVQAFDELIKVNVNGSFDLLEEAKKAKVKQVIFMSSCTVFGQILPTVDAEHPLDENHPVWPSSLYGSIKSSIEGFCHYYQKSRAFDLTILRPVTMYGVRPQLDKSEWFQTIDFLATNYNVDVKGSTKYVSVGSVVQAIQKIMGNAEASGKTYHLVDGHIHNMDLGKLIADTIDSFGEVEGVMGEDGVPMSSQAAQDLGVEFPGQEGIVEYIKLVHKLQGQYGGERSIQNW